MLRTHKFSTPALLLLSIATARPLLLRFHNHKLGIVSVRIWLKCCVAANFVYAFCIVSCPKVPLHLEYVCMVYLYVIWSFLLEITSISKCVFTRVSSKLQTNEFVKLQLLINTCCTCILKFKMY